MHNLWTFDKKKKKQKRKEKKTKKKKERKKKKKENQLGWGLFLGGEGAGMEGATCKKNSSLIFIGLVNKYINKQHIFPIIFIFQVSKLYFPAINNDWSVNKKIQMG